MHYKNGRPAKNGDKIVMIPDHGEPLVGILYNAQAGNDFCNGSIAPIKPNDPMANLSECIHIDDFKAAMPEDAPDTSRTE